VPIVSANTHSCEKGYFRREWKLAVDRMNDMAGGSGLAVVNAWT